MKMIAKVKRQWRNGARPAAEKENGKVMRHLGPKRDQTAEGPDRKLV